MPEVASEGTRKGKRSGRGHRLGATEGKAPPRPPTSESDNNGGDVNAAGPGRAYLGEDDGVFGGLDFARSLRALSPPGLTNEDSYFEEKLGTTFLFGQRPEADLDELNGLFATVGFPQRDPTRLKRALVNSHHIVWCVVKDGNKNRSTHPGQCVGFARATSDTVFYATIWDVVVSPKWQGCGIGRGMVQRLVDKLVKEDIHNITLYTEPAVEGLYRTIGFETMDTATGMAFRHQRVNSHHIVWCVVKDGNKNRSTHPGQCVGFARATSDTVFYATIWDVVVSPKWQGCGIGRGMVQRLVDKLVKEDIHNITLYTEPAVEGLYRTIGFETMDTATGMAFRHQRNARRVRGSQDTTR